MQRPIIQTPAAIIPVLDLKGGQVVRAIAGRRSEYRPIQSCLANDSSPEAIARALVAHFGFRNAYVADLDAIAGAEPDWRSLNQIAAAGLHLLVDTGLNDYDQSARSCDRLLSLPSLSGVIVGLESVSDEQCLAQFARHFGAACAVFSLDLREGRPLARCSAWQTCSTLELASLAVQAGYRRLIVLDLAAVGTNSGPALIETCRAIRQVHPQAELISGGGVRHWADVWQLTEAGCDAVLVASALHDGRMMSVVGERHVGDPSAVRVAGPSPSPLGRTGWGR